jgi:hypothetical protein
MVISQAEEKFAEHVDAGVYRAAASAAFDFVKIAKQPPMPKKREAREVVCPHVDGLQKRGRSKHKSTRPENAHIFGHTPLGVTYVFEDRVCNYGIERPVRKGDVVGIANTSNALGKCDIGVSYVTLILPLARADH